MGQCPDMITKDSWLLVLTTATFEKCFESEVEARKLIEVRTDQNLHDCVDAAFCDGGME